MNTNTKITSELIDRYPGIPGCRLDTGEYGTGEYGGQSGPAVDLNGEGAHKYSLWVRESGTGEGKSAEVVLTADNLRALRDGCTRLLVAAGVEEEVTVTVPRRSER